MGWAWLWSFFLGSPSPKRKEHHAVSFEWSSIWLYSNTGLSCTQSEQIPIVFEVWLFWPTRLFSFNNILEDLWLNFISSVEITLFWLIYEITAWDFISVLGFAKWFQIHYLNWSRALFSADLSIQLVPSLFMFVFWIFFILLFVPVDCASSMWDSDSNVLVMVRWFNG